MIPALQKGLADVLVSCEAEGMAWPYIVCCAGANGYMLAMRYAGPGEPAEELAEHVEPGPGTTAPGIALPINVMIIDGNAKAAFATISADKGLTFHR